MQKKEWQKCYRLPRKKRTTKNVTGCNARPLGMEHGHIPDSALAASSTFDMHSVGPHIARARKVTITITTLSCCQHGFWNVLVATIELLKPTEIILFYALRKSFFWTSLQLFEPFLFDQDFKGGAWCPARPIQEGVEEWLEVDLGRQHIVTATETMGRYVGVELFGWPGQAAYCHSMGILFTMDNFSFLRNLVRSMWKCMTQPPGLEVDAARSLRRHTASNTGEPAHGTHTPTSPDTRWEPRTKLLKNTWK